MQGGSLDYHGAGQGYWSVGVGANAKIAFILEDDGEIRVAVPQYPTVASLRGAAGPLGKPVPRSEMRDTAREVRLAAKRR